MYRNTYATPLADQLAKAIPPYFLQEILGQLIPRKVDDQGLSPHCIDIDITPIPAVLTVVTVVSHDKQGILRNDFRPIVLEGGRKSDRGVVVPVETPSVLDWFVIDVDFVLDNLDFFSFDC